MKENGKKSPLQWALGDQQGSKGQGQGRTAGLGPWEDLNASENREDFKVLMCSGYLIICSNHSKGDCAFST